jgi:aminoglycoside 2'-N-acetyltransferase I
MADAQALKTAYVEAVATLPAHQRNGYATRVMRRLVRSIRASYKVAALSPATTGIYTRLGWQFWRGPLSIRLPSGEHRATPEESVMVLPLPGRPALNLDQPLSAEWREGELW